MLDFVEIYLTINLVYNIVTINVCVLCVYVCGKRGSTYFECWQWVLSATSIDMRRCSYDHLCHLHRWHTYEMSTFKGKSNKFLCERVFWQFRKSNHDWKRASRQMTLDRDSWSWRLEVSWGTVLSIGYVSKVKSSLVETSL